MGARVEKGDLLLELDPVEMNQLVREGRARKEMAAAQMEQAEVDLENALSDLERRKPLAAKGIVTESEMEDLENAVKAKRSGLAVAEASYAQASASLTNLVVNRKNLKVRAPFDGLVARRYLNEGAMASPAHPVFQLHAEGKLYVRIAVPEEDVPFVRRGMAGTLRVDALSGRELTATVELVSPVLEQVTRTCTVDLLVETGDELAQVLKPGMTGEVTMVLDELSEALALPRDALVDTGREPVVFVVEDGRAVREPVEVLGEYDDFLHVRGLGDGDRVVVKGQLDLEDGVPVSVATLE
jgi:membrane fusion protein (multidrug efflux system)